MPKYLDTPEIALLLNVVHNDKNPDHALRNWVLLAFLYGTGARIGEVVNLTFDSIAYANGLPASIRIIGKGNKERIVSLSPPAQRALVQCLKVHRADGHSTSSYLWSYLTGKHRGEPLGIRIVQVMTREGFPAQNAPQLRNGFSGTRA